MFRREQRSIPAIHAVTNDDIILSPDFLSRARAVMEALGSRGAVHLRARSVAGARLLRFAEELSRAQDATESWLVVNDRIDVALAAGARGVQLTSRSIPVRDALSLMRGVAIGASVHSMSEAAAADRDGAAWLVAGHVYETASHPSESAQGESFVSELAWRLTAPVIAIGGITPERVRALRLAGAHGIAAIRGIWDTPDTGRAAAEYLSAYDSGGDS